MVGWHRLFLTCRTQRQMFPWLEQTVNICLRFIGSVYCSFLNGQNFLLVKNITAILFLVHYLLDDLFYSKRDVVKLWGWYLVLKKHYALGNVSPDCTVHQGGSTSATWDFSFFDCLQLNKNPDDIKHHLRHVPRIYVLVWNQRKSIYKSGWDCVVTIVTWCRLSCEHW